MLAAIVCISRISLSPNAYSRSKLSTMTTPMTRSPATIFAVTVDSEHWVPGTTPAAATSAAVLRTMTPRSETTSFQRASEVVTGGSVTRVPCSISYRKCAVRVSWSYQRMPMVSMPSTSRSLSPTSSTMAWNEQRAGDPFLDRC